MNKILREKVKNHQLIQFKTKQYEKEGIAEWGMWREDDNDCQKTKYRIERPNCNWCH